MTATTTNQLSDLRFYLNCLSDEEKEQDMGAYMGSLEGDDLSLEDAVEYWMGEDAAMLPAWCHLSVVGEEDEQELVHYTSEENAERIMAEGFKGIVDMRRVATSTAFRDKEYDASGFAFAFRLSEIENVDNPAWFGKVAIKFSARSLRVRSDFDDEEQSIFVAGEAQNVQILRF